MDISIRYDFKLVEKKWQNFWEQEKIYKYLYNPSCKTYSIDTPPPTVSGSLHIGHVFSYTQTEVIARYKRMNNYNVYYPFGFDNNGLPTEILTEKHNNIKAFEMSREDFTKLCLKTSQIYIEEFKHLWQSLGFSCDWESTYSTIDELCRRISQRSFIDLYNKGIIYRKEMPTFWCTKCKTTFAQAEVEDIPTAGTFYFIYFKTKEGENIPIATTRPELLSSCVAIFIHPENLKYKDLIGKKAIVPLFSQEVPILADIKADPEKGTGIVMCCTFGDTTDIDWWRDFNLPLRISFTDDGKMTSLAKSYEGLTIAEAKKQIVNDLKSCGVIFKEEPILAENRAVNTHERCHTEVEYLIKEQWFIKIIDFKEELLKQGEKVKWYPDYMAVRYKHWVENLKWDWAISRQRFYGVPIPVWYCKSCKAIKLADEKSLPVNPLVDKPLTSCSCGSNDFIGESDVLDTWATSSLTPQINAHRWEEDEKKELFPMTMRPQAHDIIRTWAFYTIAKAYFHEKTIPWEDAVISGHVVKRGEEVLEDKSQISGKSFKRKSKISKSKDGVRFSPEVLIEENSADCIRLWACSGKLGSDVIFNEDEIKKSLRLLTKLWNASRFCLQHLQDYKPTTKPNLFIVDKWILHKFNETTKRYHEQFSKYEFSLALNEIEQFFWGDFCDNYLEFVKDRLFHPEIRGKEEKESALYTLYHTLLGILKLFAPIIPHITEEIYQIYFRNIEEEKSIHITNQPKFLEEYKDEESKRIGDILTGLVGLVRAFKSKSEYSLKLPLKKLTIFSDENRVDLIKKIILDLQAISVASEVKIVTKLEENFFEEEYEGLKILPEIDKTSLHIAQWVKSIKKAVINKKKEINLEAEAPINKVILYALPEEIDNLKGIEDKIKFNSESKEVIYLTLQEAPQNAESAIPEKVKVLIEA